jgi:hypothetical protein
MAILAPLLFKATQYLTMNRFRNLCAQPEETQIELLRKILHVNCNTTIGRHYKFESIHSFKSFQRHVPLLEYDAIESYITREMNGASQQLTRSKPILFATTSGTTGTSKFIPVTLESREAKSQLMRVWLTSLYQDHPQIFQGRILTVVSPEVESYTPCGIPCGAESGHAYRNMSRVVQNLYSAPYSAFEIRDYDTKYYCLLRIAVMQDISMIASCNPSTILLLAKKLNEFRDQIIQDVHDGTVTPPAALPPELADFIVTNYPASPARARELQKLCERRDGRMLPCDIWKGLQVIACWKGGTVGNYLQQFPLYYPENIAVRDLGYLASELRGSVPLTDTGSDGVLAVGTNVYEFYSADLDTPPTPEELLTIADLQEGQQYFLITTTLGGLYRYPMNDIIEVTGFYEKTPLIRFIQKGKGIVSFTGEKLTETQVMNAMEDTLRGMEYHSEFIAAVGIMQEDKPQYIFLVEFSQIPDDSTGRRLASTLEASLRNRNQEYSGKRDSQRLHPPLITVVQSGGLENYRKRMIQSGKLDGQFKFLRITSNPAFLDEFELIKSFQPG